MLDHVRAALYVNIQCSFFVVYQLHPSDNPLVSLLYIMCYVFCIIMHILLYHVLSRVVWFDVLFVGYAHLLACLDWTLFRQEEMV